MDIIRKHLSEISEGIILLDVDEIRTALAVLKVVRAGRGIAYIFGNGGSHSTAGHFANDLMKMAQIKAVCLGDMSAVMLAYGNDNGWENMYLEPLRKMSNENDVAIGISCSGESENVLRALEYAKQHRVFTIGLTGNSESSRINALGLDALIHARYPDMRVQEDIHLMVCHAIIRGMQE